jgi:hypothetical protein
VGSGWSISHCGDTFLEPWFFSASIGVKNFLIDAVLGASVFDTTFNTAVGTTGSAAGLTFGLEGETALNITATYFNRVALTGGDPVGDLFRSLRVEFEQPLQTESLVFLMDTDSVQVNTNPEATAEQVPEPSMLVLLGAGLYAALRSGRRRTSGTSGTSISA